MKDVFIDTGAFIAARTFDDENHEEAQRQLALIKEKQLILHTSNFILDEVYTYFCKYHKIAMEMAELILHNPLITLHRVSVEDEENALALLKRLSDKHFSYTDATSFAMMERLNLQVAFSFDKHFRQYGKFKLLGETTKEAV